MSNAIRGAIRLAPMFVVAIVIACFGDIPRSAAAEDRDLVFLTWSDYLDPEIVAEFEAQTHARVKMVYFETDDDRDNLLVQSDGSSYDLVTVNGARLNMYHKHGWLAKLNLAAMPNDRHIDPKWVQAYEDAPGYAIPYFWGTVGIAYRADLVPHEVTSWMDLYRPDESLRNRIVMIKEARDLIGMALKALGYSVNTTDPAELGAARTLLQEQRPFVRAYSYVALTEDSSLVTGETAMAMVYSGDALVLQEIDDNIRFVVPKEGSSLWIDYLAVLESSTNKALALRFIDFLNRPEIAARNAQFVYYATPNRAAEALTSEDYRSDPVIYPGPEVLAHSESYRPLPATVMRTRNLLFAQIVR